MCGTELVNWNFQFEQVGMTSNYTKYSYKNNFNCTLWHFFFSQGLLTFLLCNPVIWSRAIHSTAALLNHSSLHTGHLLYCRQISVLDWDLKLKQNMAVNISYFSMTDEIATTIKIPLIRAAASDHLWLSVWLNLHLVGGQQCLSAVTMSLLSPVLTLFYSDQLN